ncbi:MAG: tetratricopeptide repeat protein [Deltaproteobacteria bacterium]|nr:tetratricopeptide repeat protein [Deltaproteobacteria bacterium]
MKRNYLLDLRDILEARTGLYLPAEKLDRLEEPFKDIRGSLSSTSPQRVIQAISVDSAEGRDYLNKLIAAVATNETYFFRTSPHFEALKNYLLPELLRAKLAQGKKSLRIWSAGCSTGEEPYSLAMLLLDNFPELRAWQTTILASDIDLDALETAQRGIYRPWSFRGVDLDVIKKHFHAEKGQCYRIDERISSLVIFQPLNLKSDPYPSSFYGTTELDIILCRNVTIYFRPETIQKVIGKFYDCLVEGGFLLTGAAEYFPKTYQDFEVRAFPETVIYQKSSAQKKPARPKSPSPLLPLWPVPQSPTPPTAQGKTDYAAAEKDQRQPVDEAVELISQGEIDKALVLLAELAEKSPKDSRISFLLGKISADRHHLSEAFHWLSQTLALDPLHRHAYFLLGLLWIEEGKIDEALQSFQKTVYIDPNFALAHFYIGRIYKEQGQIKKARQSLALVKSLLGSTHLSDPLAGAEGMTAQQLLTLVDRELNYEG